MSKIQIELPLDTAQAMLAALESGIHKFHSASPVPLGEPIKESEEEVDYPDPPTPVHETVTLPAGLQVVKDSGFRFGSASLKRLGTCHPTLIAVAKRAIQITTQDFTVFEGVRTVERQRELMRRGVTRTMNSKHLPQADGMSHAYDLVPWIDGKPVWDWEGCYRIAYAVDRAATEQGVASRIRWGAAWDRTLADFGGTPDAYMAEVQAYRRRRGGRAFLDGVHFELV